MNQNSSESANILQNTNWCNFTNNNKVEISILCFSMMQNSSESTKLLQLKPEIDSIFKQ